MRKNIGYLSLILALSGCSYDQMSDPVEEFPEFKGEVAWIRSFGGSGDDTPRSVVQTDDGGFAVLGFSNSTDGDLQHKSANVNDYWLLKTDRNGNVEWSRTYGGSKDDQGQAVIQTSDGGFAITGYAMSDDGDASNNEGFHDNWVLKVDRQGTLLWEKSFGFSGHDHSYDLVETETGGLFFAGFLDITSARADGYTEKAYSLTRHGVGEFWGTKLNSQGEIEWRTYFGGTNNDRAHAVTRAHDGGYVMAGFSESDDFDISDPRGSYDFWVVKVSEAGELIWEHSYGGTGIDIAQDIAQTEDGGYVITGSTISSDGDVSASHGESDIWVIRINAQGELLWERTYGGSGFDAAESIRPTRDGGFVIAGNSRSSDQDLNTNAGENDLWILKVDSRGALVWAQAFGGTDLDFGFDTMETSDGAILVVGESKSSDLFPLQNRGGTDLIMIRIE
ncbi:hypothetical protein SAMN06265375_101639 [Muriicola jejuensis]|uniref:Bulb-type lectin domain-containing protein n=1 Tax=Muriicola jejuensis TaxID=504488 RepID=A0A6P0UB69_9FLAO|nr:hypothetical protein [Muriicola jejuensis]NER09842.1 hypothetical protein [Muriicola jejuensis]SMP05268.1 hypothetical protein SAMN06265375_101639 [Muriicola jejuensis]